MRRFYIPQELRPGPLALTGAEAHHLRDVLRQRAGDELRVFNGQGREARAIIRDASSESVTVDILEVIESQQVAARHLILATAAPKGERLRWLVEKATELGVERLIPLNSQRSIVDPGAGKLGKLRQTIIEASKQCGRTTLMQLDEPCSWKQLLAEHFEGNTVLLAHPGGDFLDWQSLPPNRPILGVVGPEGGFTDDEVASALAAGGRLVGLGSHILRIETAAVALAALVVLPGLR